MVKEAELEETESRLQPVSEGWFVVNVRDARWRRSDGERRGVCVRGAGGLVPPAGDHAARARAGPVRTVSITASRIKRTSSFSPATACCSSRVRSARYAPGTSSTPRAHLRRHGGRALRDRDGRSALARRRALLPG